ncbi:MAG TPA: hypothetical protein VGE52_05120, partial [Pirellulales bacterium]
MKARKAPAEDEDGGLDSLMDTMFNVVGILVLVLVTTQLDVADKIRELASKTVVTPELLDSQKQALEKLKAKQAELERKSDSVATVDLAAEQERLRRVRQSIEAQKSLLKAQEKERNAFTLALDADRKKAA